MKRLFAASLVLALALPATAGAGFKTGISDQQASTFTNPLYGPLHMSVARYITPYDVMVDPVERPKLAAWIDGAHKLGQGILISFEHSHIKGKEKRIPSVKEFAKDMTLFKNAYPFVKDISPWNEANRCQRVADGTVVGQPTCHHPEKVAAFYEETRKIFRSAKIVALDFLDQNNVKPTLAYIRAFKRHVKHAPKYWGLHNYSDTNRFSQKRTKAVLKETGKGDVWLTETGGIVSFGSGFPFSESRAAKALGCMFSIAKSNKRVTRLYIYQFNGAPSGFSFDAGLINVDGTKRAGWDVVKARKARTCH